MKFNMDRMKGILTAGTLTGLVLMVALVFGFNDQGVKETATPTGPDIIVNPIVVPEGSNAETADSTYIQQLESAVQTMQSREAEYQTQIETANETILQLQDQVNSSRSSYNEYEYDDDDDEGYNDDDDEGYDDDDDEGYDDDD